MRRLLLAAALLTSFHATEVNAKPPTAKKRTFPDAKLAKVLAALGRPVALTKRERRVVAAAVAKVKAGKVDAAAAKLEALLPRHRTPDDVHAIIAMVLRQSYLEGNKDLQFYAEKVKHFNKLKSEIRDEIAKWRDRQAAMASQVPPPEAKEAADIEAELAKWEAKLATVGRDSQLANIDLQNALQKQQQTLQTLSNVSKTLSDHIQAAIRKID